jgi:hypothetical protein
VSKEESDTRFDTLVSALLLNAEKGPGGIDVRELASAIVAAQDAAARKRAVDPLEEALRIRHASQQPVPGGRVGYARRVTSKVTGAMFDVEVQESRISPLGRITGLVNYTLPEDWRAILCDETSFNNEASPYAMLKDDNKVLLQAKYERWYRPDLRYYVGALIGENDIGGAESRKRYIALPVEWPEAKASE